MTETLHIERTYQAPAEAVFDAWTNEEVLRRWWHAGHDWETTEAEVDLRVGGVVRVVMRDPAKDAEYGGGGTYTEIDPPSRLAFTWTWDGDTRRTLIEIDFHESRGRHHRQLHPQRNLGRSGWHAITRTGWGKLFANLATRPGGSASGGMSSAGLARLRHEHLQTLAVSRIARGSPGEGQRFAAFGAARDVSHACEQFLSPRTPGEPDEIEDNRDQSQKSRHVTVVYPVGRPSHMTAEFTVREARPEDAEATARLFAAVAEERDGIATEPPVDLAERTELHARSSEGSIVAEAGGRIVGMIRVEANRHGFGEVGMLVDRSWRGRGVGSALLGAAIEWSRTRGLHKLCLDVFATNDAAIGLYRKCGFVEEGRRAKQYRRSNGELWDAILMGLEL